LAVEGGRRLSWGEFGLGVGVDAQAGVDAGFDAQAEVDAGFDAQAEVDAAVEVAVEMRVWSWRIVRGGCEPTPVPESEELRVASVG
jgi:hypothetical protein